MNFFVEVDSLKQALDGLYSTQQKCPQADYERGR